MYYWISKKKAFGQNPGKNIVFGGEMPELSEERTLDLKSKGLISEKKPETFTEAQKSALDETLEANKELQLEIEELKNKLSKGGTAKLKEAKAEIKELKAQIENVDTSELDEANVTIEELKAQISKLEADLEEATKPKD